MAYHEIKHQNCIEGLKELGNEEVSLLFTSPPYRKKEGFSTELISEVARQTARILKPGGIAAINFDQMAEDPIRPAKVAVMFDQYLDTGPTIAWIKSIYIESVKCPDPECKHHTETFSINKGQYTPINGDNWVTKKWEPIMLFSKGRRNFDRLSIGIPYADKSNIGRFNHEGVDRQCRGTTWMRTYQPRTGAKLHPESMPVEIPMDIIKLAGIKSGDLMVDPFLGSGTTLEGLLNVNPKINFMGYEINPDYVKISERLLSN